MSEGCRSDLYFHLMEASRAIQDRVRAEASKWKLGITEFFVLETLYIKGSQTIQQIAGNVFVSSGSMTYVIDKLEKRGIVYRNPCPNDRRVIHIEFTPEGRSFMDEIMAKHKENLEDIFQVLKPEEAVNLINMLSKVENHIEALDIKE